MTIEVAINVLNQIKELILNDKSWLESTHEPISQCFDMAIKSLEAWDKVREEIERLKTGCVDSQNATTKMVLEIINKHLEEVDNG